MLSKLSSVLILFLFVSEALFCQVQVGVSYGVFTSRVATSEYQNIHDTAQSKFSGQQSYRHNATSFFKISKHFALRPELSFITTNFNETLDTGYFEANTFPGWYDVHNINYKYKLQQLRVPLLLNFSVPIFKIFKPEDDTKNPLFVTIDVFLGPYISYVTSASRTYELKHTRSSDNLPNDTKYNFTRYEKGEEKLTKEDIRRWSFGGIIGGNLRVGITQRIKLLVDVRSNFTQSNLNDGLWDRVARRSTSPHEHYTISPKIQLTPLATFSLGVLYSL